MQWGGERADEAHTRLHMHIQVHACVCSSKVHICATEPDSSVSCWPSGAQHVRERAEVAKTASERGWEREETVWTGSVLTLHFFLIHHLKQKGHWLWDESRARLSREQRLLLACRRPLDMLIPPTCSTSTQQTAEQHSWTRFHIRLRIRLEMEPVQVWRVHSVTTFT